MAVLRNIVVVVVGFVLVVFMHFVYFRQRHRIQRECCSPMSFYCMIVRMTMGKRCMGIK